MDHQGFKGLLNIAAAATKAIREVSQHPESSLSTTGYEKNRCRSQSRPAGYSEFSGQLETSRKTDLIASSKDLKHHWNPYSNSICTSLKIPARQ
ncbi:hypothetical protein DSO57_1000247 [Entomophthora muscae]|uniref:Uncharacterized protein n=1 Tax=Entomophthora muscae TaxID=34485 RepID=A0ACC2SYI5_9FUNG|nr:hypothetical protein DSO57_1000247 [Entomophthora muscae]